MMKDSIYMTDRDREKILQSCKDCKEDKIIITHGTDTMVDTAKLLGIKIKNKTIVLTGALYPEIVRESDAVFNLGGAIAGVQALGKGVYIIIDGRVFTWNNVRKNKRKGIFEKLNKNIS